MPELELVPRFLRPPLPALPRYPRLALPRHHLPHESLRQKGRSHQRALPAFLWQQALPLVLSLLPRHPPLGLSRLYP